MKYATVITQIMPCNPLLYLIEHESARNNYTINSSLFQYNLPIQVHIPSLYPISKNKVTIKSLYSKHHAIRDSDHANNTVQPIALYDRIRVSKKQLHH